MYYSIYRIWKTQHKTISDSGFVIHDVETSAKKKPIELMRNFQKAMQEKKKAKVPTDVGPALKHGSAPIEKVDKFVGVCDLEENKEEVHLVWEDWTCKVQSIYFSRKRIQHVNKFGKLAQDFTWI